MCRVRQDWSTRFFTQFNALPNPQILCFTMLSNGPDMRQNCHSTCGYLDLHLTRFHGPRDSTSQTTSQLVQTLLQGLRVWQTNDHHITVTPPPPYHNRFTAFFPGPCPREPVPEENFWTLWCKGRLTEAETPTIRMGATPSGLTSAHLHHHPYHTTVTIGHIYVVLRCGLKMKNAQIIKYYTIFFKKSVVS